jgi:hypothetical protein
MSLNTDYICIEMYGHVFVLRKVYIGQGQLCDVNCDTSNIGFWPDNNT